MSDASILVLNAGSSSIKFNLFEGARPTVAGQISGLGARPHITAYHLEGDFRVENRDLDAREGASHESALATFLALLDEFSHDTHVDAIGHRVVHGGPAFSDPMVIDDALLTTLAAFNPLAPLHQPHNLSGIEAARAAFPDALQVACFDTAFHRSHPWVNDTFALPRSFYAEGVRRYGFHGLSYEYICAHLREEHPDHYAGRLIVAHLGNGSSICAIRDGASIASTMGFTALDGLPMGTRCGQLDPGVVLYLMSEKGLSADAISDLLYKDSGLKGLSGLTQDMRDLLASDSPDAAGAIDYYVHRVKREVGAMAAALGGVDTIVFTGGIGEHAAEIRRRICDDLGWLGADLDPEANAASAQEFSRAGSRVCLMRLATNEEEMIRRHTARLLAR